jgi:phosphoglycolate phosphatase-like HAD superfamily hydrolase
MAKSPLVIYVDIDDTLVRSVGTKRIPVPAVIRHVRDLKQQGAELYGWSSGGAEYARQSAQELGIADCFAAFLPKPQVLLDDQDIREWRGLLQVHPAGSEGYSVEDYRRRREAA